MLNPSQIGTAAQQRFCMLAVLGSGGAIELVPPLADDEGRDFEVHLKHRFGWPLSVQVKARTTLHNGGVPIDFNNGRQPQANPAYWFFIAHLDLKTLDFVDPMFLIPSQSLRRKGRLARGATMSLSPKSRDRWVKYRVTRLELGRRLRDIVERLNRAEIERVA